MNVQCIYLNAATTDAINDSLIASGVASDDGVGGIATGPDFELIDYGPLSVYDNHPDTDAPQYDSVTDEDGNTYNVRRQKDAGGHWCLLCAPLDFDASVLTCVGEYALPMPVLAGSTAGAAA